MYIIYIFSWQLLRSVQMQEPLASCLFHLAGMDTMKAGGCDPRECALLGTIATYHSEFPTFNETRI
jgi:hypothetical protein